jgi:transcriptional regulator with XRE-family HTH domain
MAVHIGQLIEDRLTAAGISKAELGKRINRARQNVSHILTRPTIDTDLLLKISRALEYDFFQYYVMELNQGGTLAENPGEYVNMRTELRACLEDMDAIRVDMVRTKTEVKTAYELLDMFREKIESLKAENSRLRMELGISGPPGDA